MTKIVDKDRVQEALNRAAHKTREGPPRSRAGRFDYEDGRSKITLRELELILREHGFQPSELLGSHQIWHNPLSKKRVVVPASVGSRQMANAILMQAGLTKAF